MPVSRSSPQVEQSDIPTGTNPEQVGQRRALSVLPRTWRREVVGVSSPKSASASPVAGVDSWRGRRALRHHG